jgi:hypothetical protein
VSYSGPKFFIVIYCAYITNPPANIVQNISLFLENYTPAVTKTVYYVWEPSANETLYWW